MSQQESEKEKTKIRLDRGMGGVNGTLIDQYIKVWGDWKLKLTHKYPGCNPVQMMVTLWVSVRQIWFRVKLEDASLVYVHLGVYSAIRFCPVPVY